MTEYKMLVLMQVVTLSIAKVKATTLLTLTRNIRFSSVCHRRGNYLSSSELTGIKKKSRSDGLPAIPVLLNIFWWSSSDAES